jgi:hypothetical protein
VDSDINAAIDALKALMDWLKTGLVNGLRPLTGQSAGPIPVPVAVPAPADKDGGNSHRRSGRTLGRRSRNPRGSALSEFGPALFFLFIFAVFPVMDIIGLCFGYLSCASMNDLQLREAAKVPKSVATLQTGSVQQAIPQKYMATVMGAFSGLTDLPQTSVSYTPGQTAVYVQVSTTVTVRPFLTIPFFGMVPGLGEPATFTISNSRILENPRFAVE